MTTTHPSSPPQPRLPLLRAAQWSTQIGGLFQPEFAQRVPEKGESARRFRDRPIPHR